MDQPRVHVSVILADSGGLLMVQEGKPDVYGRWNLPGGHVQRGEDIIAAGVREVHEETGLEADINALLGVFTSAGAIRFVLLGTVLSGKGAPGDDIVAIRSLTSRNSMS